MYFCFLKAFAECDGKELLWILNPLVNPKRRAHIPFTFLDGIFKIKLTFFLCTFQQNKSETFFKAA